MEIVLFFTTSLWISFATSDHHFDPDWNGWIAILFSTLVILWIFIWCHQQFTFTEWNIQKSRDEIGHDFVWTFMVPNDFDDSLYVVTKLLFYGFEWNVSASTGRTSLRLIKTAAGFTGWIEVTYVWTPKTLNNIQTWHQVKEAKIKMSSNIDWAAVYL